MNIVACTFSHPFPCSDSHMRVLPYASYIYRTSIMIPCLIGGLCTHSSSSGVLPSHSSGTVAIDRSFKVNWSTFYGMDVPIYSLIHYWWRFKWLLRGFLFVAIAVRPSTSFLANLCSCWITVSLQEGRFLVMAWIGQRKCVLNFESILIDFLSIYIL